MKELAGWAYYSLLGVVLLIAWALIAGALFMAAYGVMRVLGKLVDLLRGRDNRGSRRRG